MWLFLVGGGVSFMYFLWSDHNACGMLSVCVFVLVCIGELGKVAC